MENYFSENRDTFDLEQGYNKPILTAYIDNINISTSFNLTILEVNRMLIDALIALNATKSEVISYSLIRSRGIDILGSFIGPKDTRREFLSKKIKELERVINLALKLPRQHTLLLLRECILTTLRHIPRTIDPIGLENEYV